MQSVLFARRSETQSSSRGKTGSRRYHAYYGYTVRPSAEETFAQRLFRSFKTGQSKTAPHRLKRRDLRLFFGHRNRRKLQTGPVALTVFEDQEHHRAPTRKGVLLPRRFRRVRIMVHRTPCTSVIWSSRIACKKKTAIQHQMKKNEEEHCFFQLPSKIPLRPFGAGVRRLIKFNGWGRHFVS
jgi:hypothetical protein